MKNILIIKPSALGDVIQATSVLPILKTRFHSIRITWLIFKNNAEIVMNHPLIDHVITIDRRKFLWRQIPLLLREMRTPRFDTVIDFQCLFRSALLSCMTGSPRRIGYRSGREGSIYFYTETFDIPTHSMHAVERYVSLCEALGAPRLETVSFPIPITETHREHIHELLSELSAQRPLITICPTARWNTKCWPPHHYAQLADRLIEQNGANIVLSGAPDEVEIVDEMVSRMKNPSLNLCGKISILELGALLEESDLFVGNDSAPMHLASAVGTKTVALFGPTNPKLTGPYDPSAASLSVTVECGPCFQKRCEHVKCMNELSPDTVLRACLQKLDS